MPDRVLWCGINEYPAGMQLNGCVNDSEAMTRMLVDHYDYCIGDVQVINVAAETTKRLWKQRVQDACTGLKKGDRLVLGYSGHGSYIADQSSITQPGDPSSASHHGDETYDEVMVASDLELFVDDEWRELLGNLPKGVKCTVWSDSCYSGTVTRLLLSETLWGFGQLTRIIPNLKRMLEWKVRFLNPRLEWMPQRAEEILENPLTAKPKKMAFPQSSMNHLLITGCKDSELSYDVKFGAAGYYGAATFAGLETIKAHNYNLSYSTLIKGMNQFLTKGGYPQHPSLEGPSSWKRRKVFR